MTPSKRPPEWFDVLAAVIAIVSLVICVLIYVDLHYGGY